MVGKNILHYKILEKLGEGGMGIVYKALDTKLQREVAIKFLPKNIVSNSHESERFVIEARAAAALNHPNIATIYAIEEQEETKEGKEKFLVMEYIDGKELKEILTGKPLDIEEAYNIATQIIKGLQAAHKKNIIHRDIKSANIMLTQDGEVKIMDFGLAKVTDKSMLTAEGTTLGTLAYMSPEQAQGLPADNRSDLWSAGVVFYEMFTGELPFNAEHNAAWTYVITNEQPQNPSALNSLVPPAIDSLILKMLEKDPKSRFQYAGEVLKSLQDMQSDKSKSLPEEDTKVIAVLPFENISPDKEADYFAAGLAEELIINLSRIKDMSVVSRTTTARYKDSEKDVKTIGRELEARYIMEGSVRKFQDNLRISVQLIDVSKGTQLWSETYKGKIEDVFDIQEQVSKQIVDALMLKLSPQEKVTLTKRATLNTEAFDYNLRARDYLYQLNKNKHKIAIQFFEKAIEIDPRYANAYAGLAEAYASYYQYFEKNEIFLEKSIEYGMKALMYDASLSEAYAALALCYFNKLMLNEALEAAQKAIDLDPKDFIAYWILGRIYHATDRDDEALELFKKVIELNPDFYTAYADLYMCYDRLGDEKNYKNTLAKAVEMFPRYLLQFPDDSRAHVFFANALVQSGNFEEAKSEAIKALELNPTDPLMLYNAACFYSRLGEKEKAVKTLKDAVMAGHEDYEWFKRDSDLDNIRNQPGYIELMQGH